MRQQRKSVRILGGLTGCALPVYSGKSLEKCRGMLSKCHPKLSGLHQTYVHYSSLLICLRVRIWITSHKIVLDPIGIGEPWLGSSVDSEDFKMVDYLIPVI